MVPIWLNFCDGRESGYVLGPNCFTRFFSISNLCPIECNLLFAFCHPPLTRLWGLGHNLRLRR